MKKECDIVQDLLFGYVDNTLKEGSKELVEEHLKSCRECEKILQDMKNDEMENNDVGKIDGLKKVNKKMKIKSLIIFIISFLLLIFVIFSAMAFTNYYTVAGNMQIFLTDDITEDEETNIREVIRKIDENASITYESKEVALENFKLRLNVSEEEKNRLFDGYNGENNIFPASYIIKTDLDKIDKIVEELSQIDEVKKITTNQNMNPYLLFILTLKNSL